MRKVIEAGIRDIKYSINPSMLGDRLNKDEAEKLAKEIGEYLYNGVDGIKKEAGVELYSGGSRYDRGKKRYISAVSMKVSFDYDITGCVNYFNKYLQRKYKFKISDVEETRASNTFFKYVSLYVYVPFIK